ncbi:hypothetical protein SRHO_G00005410 [Serrasalmus rhombeus]
MASLKNLLAGKRGGLVVLTTMVRQAFLAFGKAAWGMLLPEELDQCLWSVLLADLQVFTTKDTWGEVAGLRGRTLCPCVREAHVHWHIRLAGWWTFKYPNCSTPEALPSLSTSQLAKIYFRETLLPFIPSRRGKNTARPH